MTIIVQDQGFVEDDWQEGFTKDLSEAVETGQAYLLGPGQSPDDLMTVLPDLKMIVLHMPNFADGRALSQAASLRAMGFRGRLRICGHVLADQYAMLRRAGCDEAAIDAPMAQRQKQQDWHARANWQAHDYRARLGARRALSV